MFFSETSGSLRTTWRYKLEDPTLEWMLLFFLHSYYFVQPEASSGPGWRSAPSVAPNGVCFIVSSDDGNRLEKQLVYALLREVAT
jgi:hypothetical protein